MKTKLFASLILLITLCFAASDSFAHGRNRIRRHQQFITVVPIMAQLTRHCNAHRPRNCFNTPRCRKRVVVRCW
jgi:hypothetical protein